MPPLCVVVLFQYPRHREREPCPSPATSLTPCPPRGAPDRNTRNNVVLVYKLPIFLPVTFVGVLRVENQERCSLGLQCYGVTVWDSLIIEEIEPLPIASRTNTQEMPDTTVAQGGAAAALLDRLAVLGVSVRSDGGALRLAPVSLIPADVLAEVRANKAALIALLTAPVVAVVAGAPRSSLGLIPADPGYLGTPPRPGRPCPLPCPAHGALAGRIVAQTAIRIRHARRSLDHATASGVLG